MTIYSGRVVDIVFQNASTSFYIMRMLLDDISPMPVSVRGTLTGAGRPTPGLWFSFEGSTEQHPKFGTQYLIDRGPVLRAAHQWTASSLQGALTGNGLPVAAWKALVRGLGLDPFTPAVEPLVAALRGSDSIPGILDDDLAAARDRWTFVHGLYVGAAFLQDLGLSKTQIARVWQVFGITAPEVLTKNPWALTRVSGISFAMADNVAHHLDVAPTPDRLVGLVIYLAKNPRSMGHLFLTSREMLEEVERVLPGQFSAKEIGEALVSAHRNQWLALESEQGKTLIYDPWSHRLEVTSAKQILARRKNPGIIVSHRADFSKVGPKTQAAVSSDATAIAVAEVAVDEWESQHQLRLTPDQKMGAIRALTESVSVLTGLPGTGKTTSLRVVVDLLREARISFLLCAPTGIAAKNLKVRTGADEAFTIHRGLQARGGGNDGPDGDYQGRDPNLTDEVTLGDESGETWGANPQAPHIADVIIVDEASMIDQHLLYRLVQGTRSTASLVFVGDAAQLPSVGPGNVLRDLIRSEVLPVTALKDIFRQEGTSAIVFASHDIVRGNVPECHIKSDFALVQVASEQAAQDAIVSLVQRLYNAKANFQVLSPRHGGAAGVTALNGVLRELLNPAHDGLKEFKQGSTVIREGDRIMVIKNNYGLGIYNGDVGKVEAIDTKTKNVWVKIFGDPPISVPIRFGEAGSLLRLAYACTVHKAQGLEYSVIVMPLLPCFAHQLQRNLLYTAVTRAKTRVVLVGSPMALSMAVENAREDQRNTLFAERLVRGALAKETPANKE